jgi:hypothetical protein
LRWREILYAFDSPCSLKELFKPFLTGFTVTYLAPMAFFGADFLKARALRERTELSP